MKPAALAACRTLATWLFESGDLEHTWRRADKIERRFRCIGATEAFLERMRAQYREALAQDAARHDARNPERRTYLHR